MPEPVRFIAFTAHPDDEIAVCAASFLYLKQQYAHQVETIIACATKGENYARPGFSPSVREDELRESAARLRIDRLHFLGYRNGEMIQMLGPINGRVIRNESEIPVNASRLKDLKPGQQWEDHVEAVRILDSLTFGKPPDLARHDWRTCRLSGLSEKVVRLIRAERPEVVVTMEPFGNYGHNEHIIIHHAATAGFYLAGRADAWPEHAQQGLHPHTASKLYWGGLYPNRPDRDLERQQAIARARAEMGVPSYEPSLVVEYPKLAEPVYGALLAHESQFKLADWSDIDEAWRHFFASDFFLRVHPPLDEGDPPERSIADGTRLIRDV